MQTVKNRTMATKLVNAAAHHVDGLFEEDYHNLMTVARLIRKGSVLKAHKAANRLDNVVYGCIPATVRSYLDRRFKANQ